MLPDFNAYNGLARRDDLFDSSFLKIIETLKSITPKDFSPGGWDGHWARRWEFPTVMYSILSNIKPPGEVLESGSGFTVVPVWLASYNFSVTGVDPDTSLEIAWARKTTRIKFTPGDMLDLPFADGTFDASYSISAIELTSSPLRAVTALIRVTKPGGLVSLTMDIDIQNTDSVSIDELMEIQLALVAHTTSSFPIRVWSPASLLTFTNRTINPQSKGYVGLKYFLSKNGLYQWRDQCIFFYAGVKTN